MKNKFSKLLSLLLILSFLISAFSVYAFADETEGEEEEKEEYTVYINRGFEDGWDHTNGLKKDTNNHSFYIDYEEDTEYKYNYFLRAEATESSAIDSSYFAFAGYVARQGMTIVEFSIKADDIVNSLGKIIYLTTGSNGDADADRTDKGVIDLFAIDANGNLIAFPALPVASNYAASSGTGCNAHNVEKGHCNSCGYCAHTSITTQTDDAGRSYKLCEGCGASFELNLGKLENEWIDISLTFDWGSPNDGKDFDCTLDWGENYENSFHSVFEYYVANDKGIKNVCFSIPKADSASQAVTREGMSYCIDNLKIYQGDKLTKRHELDPADYGIMVGLNAEKTIEIQEGAGAKNKAQLLEDSLCLKLGVDYALFKNGRRAIYDGTYGAPVLYNGEIMVSLDILLEYIGFPYYRHPDLDSYDITTGTSATYITAGRDSATVAGERIDLSIAPTYFKNADGSKSYLTIAASDIEALFPGFLTVYDDMGLLIVYEDTTPQNLEDNQDIVNRSEDLDIMVDLMKKFVFDTVSAETIGETYLANGEMIFAGVKNNNSELSHPYIITDQTTFDKLSGIYKNEAVSTEKTYLEALIAEAEAIYADKAISTPGAYSGIKADKIPVNPYSDGMLPDENNPDVTADTTDGYDPYHGRLVEVAEYASILPKLAFAYQVTRDDKYALLAYDWSLALAEWAHWGPGFFVDCAEATSAYAISYDWLYNAYKDLGKDTDVLAAAIYELGIHDGFNAVSGIECEHARTLGDLSNYSDNDDNTNVIGTSGMIIASIATLEYLQSDTTKFEEALYLVGSSYINLINNGLVEYAPDGSYIESATYWQKATDALARLIMTFDSSVGHDFGFMDTWGLDKTCYFAAYIESSDGFIWNYHDGGPDGATSGELASLDTGMFNFFGTKLGDEVLIAVRKDMIEKGKKNVSIYDMLFYPFDGVTADADLPLDYVMDGLQAFVSRSEWEDGALYTGIMGGVNDVNHGHIDSGNFIYTNKGVNWFIDLGSENEAVSLYNGSGRYKYYRATAEGQNVLFMKSTVSALVNGQARDEGGVIIKTHSDEHGSYAIIDNASVYSSRVDTALRGLLVTGDRQIVVVQDEVAFKTFETAYWVAHTANAIQLDSTGKVAFLTCKAPDGNTYILRATLVSPASYSFSIMETTTNLLTDTQITTNIGKGGTTEYSRTGIKRLVIESSERISFNVAVVFEIVSNYDNTDPLGYEWTYMNSWQTYSADFATSSSNTAKRGAPKSADIKTYTKNAETLLKKDDAYTTMFEKIYDHLTRVAYTLTVFDPDSLTDASLINAYDDYKDCVKTYNKYLKYVTGLTEKMTVLAERFAGIVVEAQEDTEE